MNMLHLSLAVGLICISAFAAPPPEMRNPKPLFDGKTLDGWEGDEKIWRVEEGAITGGNGVDMIRRNEFVATTRDFTNFVIRFKIKLTGTEGFINSGFQIRSQRNPNNSEMKGYQCDFGEPNWYGAIYDEDRRNKVMSASDMNALRPVIKTNDWNDYVIKADGRRVITWINGAQGTDFIEQDASIPGFGKFGIQVHGGGKAKVQVKDVVIEELPNTPKFEGAPDPKPRAATPVAQTSESAVSQASSLQGPLTPTEQQKTFTLPPGFEIEVVASESEGIGKFVTVAFDTQGRMWSMTALEYPVDANENPQAAAALYASIAKDKVVVFDKPFGRGPHTPRVFAEGLAIPLGILPYKDGVYVQHGPDIKFLRDTDNDGKADKTETILTGFGVQDSHLFPHQFTRAPGNWIWMAQGAFNYGKVKTTQGAEIKFDQTRMAKFRYDGSDFDITSQGPCNIWGLVLKPNGEAFIQEANDYGYPMMQFHEYANYPGCSDAQFKSYAPVFPGTAPDFQMGGTGLSGLALSDKMHWPRPYDNVFYIANPITRKINAIRTHEDGPRYRYEKLPDFIQSSDEYFRPVALTMGPDGNLYITDWYNKIISHNEVPRAHPERDKTRGRIWRVKPKNLAPINVPNFATLPEKQILPYLTVRSAGAVHLAWQAIVDRNLTNLVNDLKRIADAGVIPALWALEGLGKLDIQLLGRMNLNRDRNVGREVIRAAGESLKIEDVLFLAQNTVHDSDPEVSAQIIRSAGLFNDPRAIALIASFALPSLAGPTMPSTHNANLILKTREAYEREFQRYLVRLMLERHPEAATKLATSSEAENFPAESKLLIALALDPKTSAPIVAKLLPGIGRAPSDEEILRLAKSPSEGGVPEALKTLLRNERVLQALIRVRNRFDGAAISPLLTEIARDLWSSSNPGLAVQLVSAFRLTAFENDLAAALRNSDLTATNQISALRALREIGSSEDEVFSTLAKSTKDRNVRHESILTLASSKSEKAPALITELWPDLNALQRRLTVERLTSSKTHAAALVKLVASGAFPKTDLDSAALDRLNAILPNDPEVQKLLSQLTARYQPVLRLDGKNDSWVDSDITLDGPFTVETWIKFAPGIDNNDGILGAEGQLDMNFYDARFRVWTGSGGDAIVAKKKMTPEAWNHLAVTRDDSGKFKIYLNGELDTADSKAAPQKFEHLKIGWSNPAKGTDAWLTEFRIWKTTRTPADIRANFDQQLGSSRREEALISFSATNWPKLHGSARIDRTDDLPILLTPEQSEKLATAFEKFHHLAEKSGDTNKGRMLFTTTCATCHTVAGQGGQIGPVLNGAAANGIETLLRALLTPNAAMEAGYRTFRVELKDGDILDGFLVSQNDEAIVLRQPNAQDRRIPQDEIRRAQFTKTSLMPESLLEGLPEKDAIDLLAYLQTLK